MVGKDNHKKLHQIFEGGEVKQEQRARHISFLFNSDSSCPVAHVTFAKSGVAASFANTAFCFGDFSFSHYMLPRHPHLQWHFHHCQWRLQPW